jgi:hypothetical protein
MARAGLDWSTTDLAHAATVGQATVNRLETGRDARISTVEKLRAALENWRGVYRREWRRCRRAAPQALGHQANQGLTPGSGQDEAALIRLWKERRARRVRPVNICLDSVIKPNLAKRTQSPAFMGISEGAATRCDRDGFRDRRLRGRGRACQEQVAGRGGSSGAQASARRLRPRLFVRWRGQSSAFTRRSGRPFPVSCRTGCSMRHIAPA